MNTAPEFPGVSGDPQDTQALGFQSRRFGGRLPGDVNAEPLPRHRLPVLQAAMTDQPTSQSQRIRKSGRRGIAIQIPFLDPHQAMLPHPGRLKAEQLLHDKILKLRFKSGAT
jgi:hypothetical protein